jgi:hypothetical protein
MMLQLWIFLERSCDMGKEVYVKIGGTMVNLLSGFDPPKYEVCAIQENGRKCYLQDSIRSFIELYAQHYSFWK